MNFSSATDNVAGLFEQAQYRASIVRSHSKDVAATAARVARSTRDVIVEGAQETTRVLIETRDRLRETVTDGISEIGGKLTRIATPSHKEQAEAHKAEIKEKKQRKRSEREDQATTA